MWHGSPELTRPFDRLDEPGLTDICAVQTAGYRLLHRERLERYSRSETGSLLHVPPRHSTRSVGGQLPVSISRYTRIPLTLDGTVKPNPAAQPLVSLNGEQLPVEHFSANRIAFQISSRDVPQEVVINQNGDSGWFCDGAEIKPNTSRLTLNTVANATHIVYIPLKSTTPRGRYLNCNADAPLRIFRVATTTASPRMTE